MYNIKGPTWDGRGGVHTHMTNTRITDPEILELRYPVILNKFSLRPGTGGEGAHRGGDGVIREMTFRHVEKYFEEIIFNCGYNVKVKVYEDELFRGFES